MAVVEVSALLGPFDRTELSVLRDGEPLVLEYPRLRSDDDARRAADVLRRAPTLTVLIDDPGAAVPALVAAADLCLTDAADPPAPWVAAPLGPVAKAIAARPEASLALAVLLRATETVDVWSAIAAEASTYSMLMAGTAHRAWLAGRTGGEEREEREEREEAEPVRIERDATVLRVILDRPTVRNALDRRMRDSLVAALALAEADSSVAEVQLLGSGQDFCAGGDLGEFGATSDPSTAFAVRLGVHPGWAAHAVGKRLTAHLHGHCIGAGIEIPAFAAHVIARGDTRIALPEMSMGLVPGAGGTASLPRRIGRQRTTWLALTGATVNARTAHRWGLVDEVVGDEP